MTPPDNTLRDLARRMLRGLPDNPEHQRQAIETGFLPLIRCALRSGVGHPSLVRWVRSQPPNELGKAPDLAQTAISMARVLGDSVMGRIDPPSGRETIVDAFGAASILMTV